VILSLVTGSVLVRLSLDLSVQYVITDGIAMLLPAAIVAALAGIVLDALHTERSAIGMHLAIDIPSLIVCTLMGYLVVDDWLLKPMTGIRIVLHVQVLHGLSMAIYKGMRAAHTARERWRVYGHLMDDGTSWDETVAPPWYAPTPATAGEGRER
jgi:hypothetical protein